jgi:hypothetical protein
VLHRDVPSPWKRWSTEREAGNDLLQDNLIWTLQNGLSVTSADRATKRLKLRPPRSPDFFLWGFLKGRVYSNIPRSLGEQKHKWNNCSQHWLTNTSQSRTKHTKKGGCLSSRRWRIFSASAVKLPLNSSYQIKVKKKTRLSSYIDFTKAYKYCCS